MEKKQYEGLKLEVITIKAEDVISTSFSCDKDTGGGAFFCPSDGVSVCPRDGVSGCCSVHECAYGH